MEQNKGVDLLRDRLEAMLERLATEVRILPEDKCQQLVQDCIRFGEEIMEAKRVREESLKTMKKMNLEELMKEWKKKQ